MLKKTKQFERKKEKVKHANNRKKGTGRNLDKSGSERGKNERKRKTMVGIRDSNPCIHQRITNK